MEGVFGGERSGQPVGLTRRNRSVDDGHELNIHLFLFVVDMACNILFVQLFDDYSFKCRRSQPKPPKSDRVSY